CDFYGNVLLAPTMVEHNRPALTAATAQLRQEMARHDLQDAIVAIERTGRYHHPTQRAFAAAGFGGLVGVELFGELTAFADGIAPLYRHVNRDDVRWLLLQGGERLMPEIDPKLAAYGTEVLRKRRGADIRTGAHARAIEPGKVHLPGETIESETIVLAAGIVPSPLVAQLPVEKDRHGRIIVAGTMRCQSHPEVWALGDCAVVPAPDGRPYPSLAQHALREARVLARNIAGVLDGEPPQPF